MANAVVAVCAEPTATVPPLLTPSFTAVAVAPAVAKARAAMRTALIVNVPAGRSMRVACSSCAVVFTKVEFWGGVKFVLQVLKWGRWGSGSLVLALPLKPEGTKDSRGSRKCQRQAMVDGTTS